MIALAQAHSASQERGRLALAIAGAGRWLCLVLLCLTPVTAVFALGWLTRRTAYSIAVRGVAPGARSRPRLVAGNAGVPGSFLYRLLGGLGANLVAGVRAWTGVLALTLPFSLIWMVGWVAGWENSFRKGYELSGLWPLVSIASVIASLPALVLLPMAVAHQAVSQRWSAIFELRTILHQICKASWRYLLVTSLIVIGSIGVLGARALPTLAEKLSPAIASGMPDAYDTFELWFRLGTTGLLVAGILIVRHMMAWSYAHAIQFQNADRRINILAGSLVVFLCAALWAAQVFTVYVAQFFDYFWWNWINQPVLMLPWLR